jgi:WD40 repeat protein
VRLLTAPVDNRGDGELAVRVWDARTGQLLLTLGGHRGPAVEWATFSADGARILTADDDGVIRAWDARTGQLQLVLRGHTSEVCTVQFSPDGQRVLSASIDGSARLWDARTGQLQAVVTESGAFISGFFSPDGRRILLSFGGEGVARIYPTPPALQQAVAQACELLRYQDGFEQVRAQCQVPR